MRTIAIIFYCLLVFSFSGSLRYDQKEKIPIYLREYDLELTVDSLGDTIRYEVSNMENLKLIFFDERGKSYCERYLKGKLLEKGYFENSLDTLSRYISGRGPGGKSTAIRVQKYFEPLKNGEWITYKGSKIVKRTYLMGVQQ